MVQILDAPVPQLVEQLPDVLRFFDLLLPVPEQVIEVPKILLDDVLYALFYVNCSWYNSWWKCRRPFPVLPCCCGKHFMVTRSGLWSRSLTVQFGQLVLEIYKVFPVDRVQRRQPSRFQPVQGSAASSSDLPGQAGQGVFRTFPKIQKSAKIPRTQGSELPPHSSPWTPAPYEASMVLEEEEEEEEECEEDFEVEYVEFDNRLWRREWDPARQQYCWWLASADGSQAGHTIWRPPWLIGRRPG